MTKEPEMTCLTRVSLLLSLTKNVGWRVPKPRDKLLYENNLVTFWKGLYTALGTSPVCFFLSPVYFSVIFAFLLCQMVNPLGVQWSLKFFLMEGKEKGVVSINSNKTFHMTDINVFDFSHAFRKGLSCQSPLSTLCSHLPSVFKEGEDSLQCFWGSDSNELELSSAEPCGIVRGGRGGEAVSVQLTQVVSRAQRPWVL